ncbi:complex I assembly factor ACAD9, mitochondrial-like [Porites lutea]|uniref:complex I assembly factor ACAD9, mitochondrial-like n=1 Tax=Porites lutea TaxID=51062 RepID=UPI003CC6D778
MLLTLVEYQKLCSPTKYGKNIIEEQLLLNRMADACMNLFAIMTMISRAARTINQGLSSASHEVLLTDTICTNKCNMNNALFEEATQHEKRNVSERNGGVKLA